MGFDNECILNIQSLAGEYFCPVCRLLVYPNEAWQSLCTHLYCKPCLSYVANTTRACPYDGYLVTEPDSKPLVESNKSLADTIGKVAVHCLFHRSGCTWQGSLSDCTPHCSGCAFGNSAVICNRCGIQILHRQVQEHAQSCAGTQTQGQGETGVVAQGQSANPGTAAASQLQATQTAVDATGKDPNQQAQANVPTAEQFYQQQYQQFYQQYPGYDQYQQYYAHQQQLLLAHASQPQPQPQPQPHASLAPAPVAAQPQNQAVTNMHHQVHSMVPPYTQAQPEPHLPAHHGQLPPPPPVQYQQAHPQPHMQQQIQTHVQPHLLAQNPTTNAVAGHHLYVQPKMETGVQQKHAVQLQGQFPQQHLSARPPHSHAAIATQQQQLVHSRGQVQNTTAQQLFQQPYLRQSGQTVHHHGVVQPVQQAHMFPQQTSHGLQHANSPIPTGRPSLPSQGLPSQLYLQHVAGPARSMHHGINQETPNQNNMLRTSNQIQSPFEHSGAADSGAKPLQVVANASTGPENEKSVQGNTTLKESKNPIGESKENGNLKNNEGALNEGPENVKHLPLPTLDSSQQNNPPVQAPVHYHDTTAPLYQHNVQGTNNPQVNGVQVQASGFIDPAYPLSDQGMPQSLPAHYRPPNLQQLPGPPPLGPAQAQFGPQVRAHPIPPHGSFPDPSHVGMMPRETPHGPEMLPSQRPSHMDHRWPDPHFPDPLAHGPEHGRSHFQAERFNTVPAGPNHHFMDRAEDFPRPFDRGPHGPRYDAMFKMESRAGSIPQRFLPPYDGGPANYRGERMDDRELFGPGPSLGRRHMDGFGSWSPSRFAGSGPDELHGRQLHRFGDPFAESRFPMLPSHLRSSNRGIGDFIGEEGFSSHLSRFPNLHSHLRSRERDGFGADRPSFPHIGEPGFRSSYSLHGFPNGGGAFAEELAFDNSKKRKQPSTGWCRICKVDCETVEGLELHSQTEEHQKTAMDIVITIKQNAKRKKLNSVDQSSVGDTSIVGNGDSEDPEKDS